MQDRPADGGRGRGPRGVRRRSATSGPLGGADVTGRGEEVADEGLPGVHGDGLSTIGRKGPLRNFKRGKNTIVWSRSSQNSNHFRPYRKKIHFVGSFYCRRKFQI